MSIGEFILEFSTSLFDLAAIFYLITTNYKKKDEWSKVNIAGIVLFTLLMVMMNHYLGHDSFLATIIPILGIYILSRYSYGVGLIRFFLVFLLFVAYLILTEFIVITFLTGYFKLNQSILMEYNIYRIYYGIISKIIMIIPVYLTGKVLSKERIELSPIVIMTVVILLINFVSSMFGLKLYSNSAIQSVGATGNLTIIMLSMALLSLFIIVFTRYIMKIERKNFLFEASEKEYKNMVNYMGEIESLYNDLRSQRHDYINHVETIKGLIDNKDISKAGNYVGEIISAEASESMKLDIGNSLVNSIIGYKKRVAEGKNIDFKYDVKIPPKLGIRDIDITIILSNAIDNAIEACERLKDVRFIDVYMNYGMGKLKIKISNSFDGEFISDDKGFVTSKEDAERHGIGLQNMERVVEKYDGIMEILPEGNEFILEIMI